MTETSSGERLHVDYPPVPNGMDYLDSVVDHLSGEPKPRDLKYAVLHLQAGVIVKSCGSVQLTCSGVS